MLHISLLKQNTIRRRQVDKITSQMELDINVNEEYKVEAICNSEIYTKKLDNGHNLLGFYYLVL